MNMKTHVLILALCISLSAAVEIGCSDNATCIQKLTDELVKGVRQNKTVNVLDLVTVEPIAPVIAHQGRSSGGLFSQFFNTHAVRADFGRYSVRVSRSAKKGTSVNVEVEYNGQGRALQEEGRRRGKKILQVFLPLVLGFKAASTIIVAVSAVALLTFKAFLASKLALLVTGSMIVKKFMESFGGGLGMHHQPYVFSQYPIDFPSAGAHPAYTMTQTAYAAPELYGLAAGHGNEMLQQPLGADQAHELSGQYSQGVAEIANPNVTSVFGQKAGKRWDQEAASYRRRPIYYEEQYNNQYNPYQEY